MKTTLGAATIVAGCALGLAGCSSSTSAGGGGNAAAGSQGSLGGASSSSAGSHSGGSAAGGAQGVAGASTAGGSGGLPGAGGASGSGGGTAAAGSANGGAGGAVGAGGAAGAVAASGAGGGSSAGASSTGVAVQLDKTEQAIDGFGINDTWATAMTSSVADALFSATDGIGLSIMRVGMGSDGNVMSSNITADIPMAKSHGATKIIGSCWTPPASCKDNNSEDNGGHVLTSCYDSWSTKIASFAQTNGLYAMSIANEPDFASCGTTDPCNGTYQTTLFTANEMVAFLKVAGPKLKTAGVKVIAPEASEWNHIWSNTSAGPDVAGKNSSDPLKCGFPPSTTGACTTGGGYDYGHYLYKDSTAWAAFDIMGVHQYDSQVATPWPSDVPDKKTVWQTEMSGVKWWPEQGPSSDINDGVAIAGWIHDALVNGQASAWIWWWYQASSTDDNEGLLLKSGTDTKRHYTLGNFSKFIRPGYTRVDVTGNTSSDLLLSAYSGTDGTVVVVAVNKGSASVTVPIAIAGGTAPASLTPWVTSATDNLVSKTAVPVSGGSFSATLASETVTTFVGK